MKRTLIQKINRKRLIALLALIGWLALLLFSGNLRSQEVKAGGPKIKIGLLVPSESHVEAVYGAQYVVDRINEQGGLLGSEVELLVRYLDGPWGQGTNQVVDLVYKEKVMAILGAHHGRNAHLVEQVIAKTQIPFISAWASDPTLSQAFVPWYFSCTPNSNSQALAFEKELLQKKGHRKILLVSDGSYDANLDREHFLKMADTKGKLNMEQLDYRNQQTSETDFSAASYDAVILFGEPSSLGTAFSKLQENYGRTMVYGSFTMLGEGAFAHFDAEGLNKLKVMGSGSWLAMDQEPWHMEFVKEFNRRPGATVAYTYDATSLLLNAIRASVADGSGLLEHISKTEYNGLTGVISFDTRGNRRGIPHLLGF